MARIRRRIFSSRLLLRYAVAVVCASIAFAVRFALNPVLEERLALMLFIPAVLIAASYGGLGPGLVALVLGGLFGGVFFLEPRGSLRVSNPDEIVLIAAYLLTTAVGVAMFELLHRTRLRAERTAAQLQQAQEELVQHAQLLEQKIAERTAKLEETIESLQSFNYSVAHDLRSPIRAMQGFAAALLEDFGRQMPEPARDFAERIVCSAGRLDQLILDLLEFGRLSQMELPCRQVDLQLMIESVLSHMTAEIEAANGSIEVFHPLPPVRAHPAVLQQVLTNLISNALKFARPGVAPRIRIGAEHRDGHVRIWIKDNGIGFDPAHKDRIFRVFERLHTIDRYQGTGIGLALVQKGVERMGGRVGAESEPGEGSCFWFELPGIR